MGCVPCQRLWSLVVSSGLFAFIAILLIAAVPGNAQTVNNAPPDLASANTAGPSFESGKIAAAQKFHRGAVLEAARDMRQLVSEAPDKSAKAYLWRDIADICVVAYERACVLEAVNQALTNAGSDASLKPLIPSIASSLIAITVWGNDPSEFVNVLKAYPISSFDVKTHPAATAVADLAIGEFYLRLGDHRLAETVTSGAILGLLLMDPKDEYMIFRVLIELLGSLIRQQDFVGATSLVRVAGPYLMKNLNHDGPDWAKYVDLAGQLFAFTNRHKAAAPVLALAAQLNQRLDINDGVRMNRLVVENSLQSLALLLDHQFEQAYDAHAQHPLQFLKNDIIQRGEFETVQEFYFAVSDVLFQFLKQSGGEQIWAASFEKLPERWKLDQTAARDADSYRQFARGMIAARQSKAEAAALFQEAARERIDNFEAALKARSEGFQLPSSMDIFIIGLALSSIAKHPPSDQYDLMLRGSEMLSRSLRQQLSDFSVLLGSQATERGRDMARSYHLLRQQKRDFEMQQIKALLDGRPRDVPAYSELFASVGRLRDSFASSPDYTQAIGYPDVKQLQGALNDDEVFVTYVPTLDGMGRLCISRTTAVTSFVVVDEARPTVDTKLLQLALTADDAPDEVRDGQYPAEAAVRLGHMLFDGLDGCMTKGGHVNVALPVQLSGIPLAALLMEMPPAREVGYDLEAARWLGNDYSFSVTVSARHLLGLKRAVAHQQAPKPYLGVGDPALAPMPVVTATAGDHAILRDNPPQNRLQDLPPLPETAEELSAVQKLLGADPREVLTGKAATEQAFRAKELGAYDIIHFATHGLLKGEVDGLSEPALVLSPVDPGNSSDDGLLSASEITHLSLNARLVVLSACNTAKIDTAAASLGANDLQAAFSVAGAPALLASLWPVETTTARDLMTGFFQAWQQQASKSASRALALATRAYLAHADRAHQHPRFWASFVVLGYGDTLAARH
jgi:CHAT domain-containing protein